MRRAAILSAAALVPVSVVLAAPSPYLPWARLAACNGNASTQAFSQPTASPAFGFISQLNQSPAPLFVAVNQSYAANADLVQTARQGTHFQLGPPPSPTSS